MKYKVICKINNPIQGKFNVEFGSESSEGLALEKAKQHIAQRYPYVPSGDLTFTTIEVIE